MNEKHGGCMETLDAVLFALVVIFIIAFALREVWTWFLKINEMSKKQTELIEEQKETNRILKMWARAEASKHKNNHS